MLSPLRDAVAEEVAQKLTAKTKEIEETAAAASASKAAEEVPLPPEARSQCPCLQLAFTSPTNTYDSMIAIYHRACSSHQRSRETDFRVFSRSSQDTFPAHHQFKGRARSKLLIL